MKTAVQLKQDGKITLLGVCVGNWGYEDIHALQGKYDKSGNRLAKCFWHAYLINGEHLFDYTRKDLKQAIGNRWSQLLNVVNKK